MSIRPYSNVGTRLLAAEGEDCGTGESDLKSGTLSLSCLCCTKVTALDAC